MTLRTLAPLASCQTSWKAPAPQVVPTNSDWATLYSEIERLYVRERRKLRYIIRYMEMKYGFKATQQMYKKRLAKWGMQKNSRRSATTTPTEGDYISSSTATPSSATTLSRRSSPIGDLSSVPISPIYSNDDSLVLMFLTNVRIWSLSFYESVQSNDEASISARPSFPEQCEEMNITFKLVVDILNRGHGLLAGRVARKAFLLAEEMLMLDGPALVWNMLEIMHYTVMLGHSQLFQLLLAHLTALVDGQMPKTHPLSAMLRMLRVFVASLPEFTSTSDQSSPPRLVSGALLSMIEQAWILNAEILFERFDDRLFQLYLRVHWDTCSIQPPSAIIGATKQYLAHMTSQEISRITATASQTEGVIQITPFREDRLLQSLFTTPISGSPPQNYESLRVSNITALRDHAQSVLSKPVRFAGDTTALLRILAGLVTTKILDAWPAMTDLSEIGISETSKISRGQAGNLACAVKTSMDLNAEDDGLAASLDNVERIQFIVALREYADTKTNPRVIREMWLLEEALITAGEYQKALEVQKIAYRRLDKYIQDIPINSA